MKITVNGVTLSVQESGGSSETPSALIFLHYFGGSSRAWAEVITRLSDFRCIAPDLRGFGDSNDALNHTPGRGYTIEENADDIAMLLNAFNVERFTLVGHSMGGKIALALAARRPRGLQSVLLLAPSPPTPEPMDNEERQRLLDGYGDRYTVEQTIRSITTLPLSRTGREVAVADGLRTSQDAWRAWLQDGSHENISERIEQIEVPVSILAGECDATITPDLLRREIVQRIKGTQLRVVPDAGHLLPLEAPQEVADACRFFASN